MLVLNLERKIREIAWLPNGNLLGFHFHTAPPGETDARYRYILGLHEWRMPNFEEVELGRIAVDSGKEPEPQHGRQMSVSENGDVVLLREPFCCVARRIGEDQMQMQHYRNLTRITMSNDGLRFLGTSFDENQHYRPTTIVREFEQTDSTAPEVVRKEFIRPEYRPGDVRFFYLANPDHFLQINSPLGNVRFVEIEPTGLHDEDDDDWDWGDPVSPNHPRMFRPIRASHEFKAIGERRAVLPYVGRVWFSPDRSQLILRGTDLMYFDLSSPDVLPEPIPLQGIREPQEIHDLSFSPDRRFVAFIYYRGVTAEIYDLTTQQVIRAFDFKEERFPRIDFSRDGTMIAVTCQGYQKIVVWDVDF